MLNQFLAKFLIGTITAVLLVSFILLPNTSFAVTTQTNSTNTQKPTDSKTNTNTGKPSTVTNNASTEENIDETGRSGFVICGNTADTPCNVTHLFRAFIIIINYMITMAGFVAVLFIVIAGVQMVISQGQEQLKAAKDRLSGAIVGLVLVALSFVLVNSLLAGSLSLGIKDGGSILTNPKKYINQGATSSGGSSTNTNTSPNSNTSK